MNDHGHSQFVWTDEAAREIKKALRERSGRAWSVSADRGTARGWMHIKATKKYAANEYGDLTEEDARLLADLLGLEQQAHHQGVSIMATSNARREYIDRARGVEPCAYGERYWD